jgi:hypothetical protein
MSRNRPIGFPNFVFNIAIFATDGKKTGGSVFGFPHRHLHLESDGVAGYIVLSNANYSYNFVSSALPRQLLRHEDTTYRPD